MEKNIKFKNSKPIIVASIIIIFAVTSYTITSIIMKKNINNNVCVVEFDTAGGTIVESQSIRCGSKIVKPQDPMKEGFEFINWYNNIEIFNFDKPLNDNIVLTAKWQAKDGVETIKVHFDTDGGTIINDYEVLLGGTITTPINPTKDGYDFEYWMLNNEKFDFKTKIDNEITLVAKWKKSAKKENNSKTTNDKKTNTNNSESKDYIVKKASCECWGGFASTANDIKLTIRDIWNYNYLWNIPYEYAGNDKCKFKYKSSNENVISIDEYGNTMPKGAGVAYLSKCINDIQTGEEIACVTGKITIDDQPVKEIVCNGQQQRTLTHPANDIWIQYTIKPGDFIDKNITASVDDSSIIEITKKIQQEADYAIYSIKTLKPGTTKVRLTASNGVSGYCEFVVESAPYIPPQLSSVSISQKEALLYEGENTTLTFSLNPSEASATDYWHNWETSNSSVATVDSNGKIVAKSVGTADITINFGGAIKDTCHVTVTKKPFSASGNIAYTIITTSQGTYSGVKAEVNASGGAGNYRYTIVLYKEGQKVAERSNSSVNNTVAYTGNGTYTAEYTVTDAEGNTYSGTLGPTVISVQ